MVLYETYDLARVIESTKMTVANGQSRELACFLPREKHELQMEDSRLPKRCFPRAAFARYLDQVPTDICQWKGGM